MSASPERSRLTRRSKTVEVTVDVDMGAFDDDDIREEYIERFNDGKQLEHEDLQRVYQLLITGQTQRAADEMHAMLRDFLGKTL